MNNPKRLYCYVSTHCVLLIFPGLERKAISILHPKQQEKNMVYNRLDRHSCHPNTQKTKTEGLTGGGVQLVSLVNSRSGTHREVLSLKQYSINSYKIQTRRNTVFFFY